jgi:hypothetical protein
MSRCPAPWRSSSHYGSAVRQRSSSWSRPNGPCSPSIKTKSKSSFPRNVDHPWGWEGKIVAIRLASGTHRGFDAVGLLHRLSSSVWRLRSDCPILLVFGPLVTAELCTGRSGSKMRCKAPNGQRPLCADCRRSCDHDFERRGVTPESGQLTFGGARANPVHPVDQRTSAA